MDLGGSSRACWPPAPQESIGLLFTPIEDATVGLWLSAMDLRHVSHPRFRTFGTPCCFEPAVRRSGDQLVSQFQLQVRCL